MAESSAAATAATAATADAFVADNNATLQKDFQSIHLSKKSARVPHHIFRRRWGHIGACRSLTRVKRQQLVQFTAATGCMENLDVAIDTSGLALGSKPRCGSRPDRDLQGAL